jgi:hypothetical protein
MNETHVNEDTDKKGPTEEFKKVIVDLVNDLKATFPEYEPLINKWWTDKSKYGDDEAAFEQGTILPVFEFCKKKFPPRFFDILYQNEDMFKEDSTVDTEFLPRIYFKSLWAFDISQKTKDTIWKYLQLILFSVVGTMENKDMFGDTAKLFEGIGEDEFKSKLAETMEKMQDLFEGAATGEQGSSGSEGSGDGTEGTMPNAEDIHQHIAGMLDGKLGSLAKEIAEETASDLNMDMENVTDMKDVFSNLMKNPTKLMGMVKNVGDKIDSKIKSGELKESELISEATEMMQKMKNMPGMGDIQSLLNKMGMGGAKPNMGAMEAQLERNLKNAKMKERLAAKAEANRVLREAKQKAEQPTETLEEARLREDKLLAIFNAGEKAERTPRGAQPQAQPQAQKQNKKKKGKK